MTYYLGLGILVLLIGVWISRRFAATEFGTRVVETKPLPEKPPEKELLPKNALVVPDEKPASPIPRQEFSSLGTLVLSPVKLMHNAGRTSARAALETELYALSSGDVDLVASVLTFDPLDKPTITDLLSIVPAEIRKQYRTPERIVAFMIMGGQRMEAITVIAETPPREDVVIQHIRYKFYDDPTIHDDALVFTRDSNGWSNVFPVDQVKRMTEALKTSAHN